MLETPGCRARLDLAKDPRVLWLVELLRKLDPQKVLLISRSIEKAEALDAALRRHLAINTGVFHEGLTLVQRDRNAAWFAEPDGARLLICSEIGSEGRNFQFAHHLVLFDLPLNPELLEQRIGRLDRIGQAEDIQIHVPFLAHSPQEVLARWYHEGLNAFESNLEGGNELLLQFGRAVHDLALEFPVADRGRSRTGTGGPFAKDHGARPGNSPTPRTGPGPFVGTQFVPSRDGATNHRPDSGARGAAGFGGISAGRVRPLWRSHRGTGSAHLAVESRRHSHPASSTELDSKSDGTQNELIGKIKSAISKHLPLGEPQADSIAKPSR